MGKKTMAVSLPQDIILFQIITWVPTKSAVRFKCVSKQWNSFIKSDTFKEMHNDCNLLKDDVCPHMKDENLFFLSEDATTFYTIDCESLPNKAPMSRPLPAHFVEHPSESPPQYIRILTSYHGLLCLRVEKNVHHRNTNVPREFDIILWNPATREFKRLSKPSNSDHMECYTKKGRGYGLYYSLGEDDYKLLVVTMSNNAYIYSLRSDSWRKLDTEFLFQDTWTWRPGFSLSNSLYFLSQSNKIEGSMRFDTKTETFREIKPPPVSYYKASISINVQKGCIHFCAMYDDICIELWKYIADEDIWFKVVTYQLVANHWLYPLHLMRNDNLLMIDDTDLGSYICQVDLIKKKYNKAEKDSHKSKCGNKSKGDYHDEYKLLYYSDFRVGEPEEVIYTETFVSPNRYTK